MEPFDLNAIEVNVEIDQNDSPVHIIWNDGRVFDIVSCGAVVPCPSKTGPELATVRDVFIALSSVTTGYGLSCRSKNEDGYERLKIDSHIHLIFLAGGAEGARLDVCSSFGCAMPYILV